MTFISYAQNFEDVLLWRALQDVEQGFYIDLGAWSPVDDSVTAAFYGAGWHGINVEPNPELHAELSEKRPRDINLAVAISDTEGTTQLLLGDNTGLGCIAESTQAHDSLTTRAIDVSCTTLNNIVATHLPPNQPVHFLKIDIEGMESAVVNHTNWHDFQPWIVVVEATKPMSMTPDFEAWEPALASAGYEFVYSDGINRFYVAPSCTHLKQHFSHPPNYFDNFMHHTTHVMQSAYTQVSHWAAELEADAKLHNEEIHTNRAQLATVTERVVALDEQLAWALYQRRRLEREREHTRQQHQSECAQRDETIASLQSQINQQRTELEQQRAEIAAIKGSTSWRITAPLRALVNKLRGH
jgi:FkbM family methyltransferase